MVSRAGSTPRTAVDLRSPHDSDVAKRIGHAWLKLRRGASSVKVREYFFSGEPEPLETGQMDTLDVLVARESWRMSELAEALHVDPSTATRAVQRLERQQLATRQGGPDDGRVVNVSATPAARALHRRVDERRAYVITELMSAFSDEDRTNLADLMTRFVRALDTLAETLPAPAEHAGASGSATATRA